MERVVSAIQSQNTYMTLASGSRINRASDDAAGLSISEKLRVQKNGYTVGSSNAEDGRSMINVAEGALSGMPDSLQRIWRSIDKKEQ